MKEIKSFVKDTFWLTEFDHGWGNGYVVIPKGHKLHGMNYDDIHTEYDIDVHGGLTFGEYASGLPWEEIPEDCEDGWVIGFDTNHYNDSSRGWTKERVEEETEDLKRQVEEIK